MTVSYNDAINLLRSNPAAYDTLDKLRTLAAQVSTDAAEGFTQGKTTVLYSGTLSGGVGAPDVITSMVTSGADVRVLDKTQAFQLLTSDDFLAAVGRTQTPVISLRDMKDRAFRHSVKDWLFDGKSGPWADTSNRFVQTTTGPVKILTESPRATSVFLQTELPALFQKLQTSTDITEVSGINRQKWLAEFANDTDRINALVRSAASETLLTKPTPSNFGSFINLTESGYLSLQRSAQSDYFVSMQKVAKDYPMTAVATRSFARLGAPLAALGAVLVGFQAGEAHAAGRPDEARTMVEDYAAEMAASTAGQAAGATLAILGIAALAAGSIVLSAPAAVGIVLIASVAGGYFGGEWGKDIAYLFQDRTEAQQRDIAKRMLKLIYGDSYSLATQVPQSVVQNTLSIDATFSRDEMVAAAKQDIAWRYALRELNPFVIKSVNYDIHNTGGNLDLYNKETAPNGLTDEYLADRAAMLAWKLRYDKEKKPYGSDYNTNTIQGNWDFVDVASGVTLQIDGKGISLSDHQIVFGSKEADAIDGSGDTDRLYGMAGNDTLDGKAGNDYIEGGAGDDKLTGGTGDDILKGGTGKDSYIFTGLFGNDSITDSDGLGNITINGVQIAGLTQVQDNVWENSTRTLVLTQVSAAAASSATGGQAVTNLIIGQRTSAGAGTVNATITVNNFTDGNLGINLGTQTKKIETNGFIIHDRDGTEDSNGDGNKDNDQDAFYLTSQFWRRSHDVVTGPITLDAGAGNDLISGKVQAETISGGAGNDFIAGGGGKDVLLGGAGFDWIVADAFAGPNGGLDAGGNLSYPSGFDASNSTIPNAEATLTDSSMLGYGWAGYFNGVENKYNLPAGKQQSDTSDVFIDGGDGTDHIWGAAGHDLLQGGEGAYADLINGGYGDDVLLGGQGADMLSGDDVFATLGNSWAQHGKDRLYGGAGHDLIAGGGNDDQLIGDAGDDVLDGDGMLGSVDRLTYLQGASEGNQYYFARGAIAHAGILQGNDHLDGGAGNDQLYGGGGADIMLGADGSDFIVGDGASASLGSAHPATGKYGKDEIDGGAGHDEIRGEGNGDVISGGSGNDLIYGDRGFGHEVKLQDHGDDVIDGGEGNDTLVGDAGDDVLSGGAGNDTIYGDDITTEGSAYRFDSKYHGNDVIDGGDGNDVLEGGGGNDLLLGGAGNDQLLGGDGNDRLVGGAGADILKGGAGNDTYVYDAADAGGGRNEAGGLINGVISDKEGSNTLEINGASLQAGAGAGSAMVLTGASIRRSKVAGAGQGDLQLFLGGTAENATQAVRIEDALRGSVSSIRLVSAAPIPVEGSTGGNEAPTQQITELSLRALVRTQLQERVVLTTVREQELALGGALADELTIVHSGTTVNAGLGADVIRNRANGTVLELERGDGAKTLEGGIDWGSEAGEQTGMRIRLGVSLSEGITTNSVALCAGSICSKPLKRFKNRACRRDTKLHAESASGAYGYCVKCYRKRSESIAFQSSMASAFGGQHA